MISSIRGYLKIEVCVAMIDALQRWEEVGQFDEKIHIPYQAIHCRMLARFSGLHHSNQSEPQNPSSYHRPQSGRS